MSEDAANVAWRGELVREALENDDAYAAIFHTTAIADKEPNNLLGRIMLAEVYLEFQRYSEVWETLSDLETGNVEIEIRRLINLVQAGHKLGKQDECQILCSKLAKLRSMNRKT